MLKRFTLLFFLFLFLWGCWTEINKWQEKNDKSIQKYKERIQCFDNEAYWYDQIKTIEYVDTIFGEYSEKYYNCSWLYRWHQSIVWCVWDAYYHFRCKI